MAQQKTTPRPTMADPFSGFGDSYGLGGDQPSGNLPTVSGPGFNLPAGARSDQAMAQIITAQRVAVKRDIPHILQEIKALAHAAGAAYYYSIPFRNKKKGTTEHVEGGTIKMAVDLARTYGNCTVEAFPAKETPTHWVFAARFIDFEKGFTLLRSYQQRKAQNTGMGDGGRAEDLIFQIGQSKAIRNVILGALATYADEAFQTAKSGLLGRIEGKPDKAREWLQGQFGTMRIPLPWVERVVGRTVDKWTARDMAQLYGHVNSINDGFVNAEDLFPNPDDVSIDDEPTPAKDKAAVKDDSKAKSKAQRKAKDEPAPKADDEAPEPEAPAQQDGDPQGGDEPGDDASLGNDGDGPADDDADGPDAGDDDAQSDAPSDDDGELEFE